MVQQPYNLAEQPWLLVSDADETLVGDDAALGQFIEAVDARAQLRIAINSSRPIGSLRGTFQDLRGRGIILPHHATITAMGTEIHIGDQAVTDWTRRFQGWDRRIVDQTMQRLGHAAHRPELQAEFKASFAVPQAAQEEARRALAATGLATRIIASGESDFDILPPGAGKGAATLFLAEQLGVNAAGLVVAGDSANDLEMFRISEQGIVVGNARPELRDALNGQAVYFAQASRALGVLEGLRYYGALPKSAS